VQERSGRPSDDALAAPLVKHRAAVLEPRKLGVLLRAIDEFTGTEVVKLAMQILPHVFLRPRIALWQMG
jgi:hypothetical protein